MADEKTEAADEDTVAGADVGKRRRFPGKKLIILAVAVLALVGGGFAAAYFAGILPGGGDHETATADAEAGTAVGEHAVVSEPVYYELPQLLVNLNTGGRRTKFLKVLAKLELESAAGIPHLEARLPRIMDRFQVYLRELRPSELSGSAGTYRLREALLRRLRLDLAPVSVRDLLFVEIFTQ